MNNIIPKPNSDTQCSSAEAFAFDGKKISVNLGAFNDSCIKAFLDRTDFELVIDENKTDIALQKDDSFSAEEYTLSVSTGGIAIKASCGNGVILALTSLYLLMDENGAPGCLIHDKPRDTPIGGYPLTASAVFIR
jgi:N-acetyl-beta-hexosaminidase